MRRSLLFSAALFLLLAGCIPTEPDTVRAARLAQRQAISQEAPGDYFIGRRYYNDNYKFWGYVRRPGQPWREARLVIFNEKQKLAPDRADNHLGEDNNYEYRLFGRFTGDKVYEPPSNRLYPEFQLKGYELINRNPPTIFPTDDNLTATAIRLPD